MNEMIQFLHPTALTQPAFFSCQRLIFVANHVSLSFYLPLIIFDANRLYVVFQHFIHNNNVVISSTFWSFINTNLTAQAVDWLMVRLDRSSSWAEAPVKVAFKTVGDEALVGIFALSFEAFKLLLLSFQVRFGA